MKVGSFEVRGTKYAYNLDTMDVYDYSNFELADGKLMPLGNPVVIGKLEKKEKGFKVVMKK